MSFNTGHYGQDWTHGVLAEHLPASVDCKVVASGRLYALRSIEGRKMVEAIPVLCGEVVPIHTEDGVIDGRCGFPVHGIDGFACPGHQAQILSYRTNYDHLYEQDESF